MKTQIASLLRRVAVYAHAHDEIGYVYWHRYHPCGSTLCGIERRISELKDSAYSKIHRVCDAWAERLDPRPTPLPNQFDGDEDIPF